MTIEITSAMETAAADAYQDAANEEDVNMVAMRAALDAAIPLIEQAVLEQLLEMCPAYGWNRAEFELLVKRKRGDQ